MTSDAAHSGRSKQPLVASGRLAWIAALAASATLVLLSEVGKHHYAASTLEGRIVGGLLFWLMIGGVFRLVIHLVALALRRVSAKPRSARDRGRKSTTAGKARSESIWPRPTARTRTWTVRHAVAALTASLLLLFAVGLALRAVGAHLPRGVGGLITEVIFLVVLIPLYRSGRIRAVDLGLRWVPGARSAGLAVAALMAYGVFSSFWAAAVHAPRARSTFAGIAHHSVVAIVLAGIAACVAAPVVEELFFRGFLYRSLRNRMAVAPASLIVGVIFGLGHTQYPLLVRPELAFFGVAMCLLYERTGSLLPGIAVHSFIDASGFEAALTGRAWVVESVFLLLVLALLLRPGLSGLRRVFSGGRVATE
jgi:CAAX protease family protein